jgi:hypothetical protein
MSRSVFQAQHDQSLRKKENFNNDFRILNPSPLVGEDGLSTHLTPWDRGAMLGACMCVVATFPCPFWIEYEKRFVKNRIYRGANCRGESVSVLGGDLRAAGCRT